MIIYFEIVDRQLGIEFDALLFLALLEDMLEFCLIDSQNDIAEHLDETTIRIVGETIVFSLLDQPLDRLVVEAEIQDRIHHAGHGELGAGANRNQKRVYLVAESHAG